MKRICILCGAEIKGDDERLYLHIENKHDTPVRRPNETEEQSLKRFRTENKRAGTENCQCLKCQAERALINLDSIAG